MKLTILGTGSATPTVQRNPSAQVLSIENENFLIDCGEGTQIQLLKNKVKVNKIKRIFISHLHGDHYFGLIGLISSLNLANRKDPLTIYAPIGLDEIITLQLKAASTSLNFQLDFEILNTDLHYQLFENESITVFTIPLLHRVPCCGFLFIEKPHLRNILIENLPQNIKPDEIRCLKEGKDVLNEDNSLKYSYLKLTSSAKKSKSFAYCSDTAFNPEIIKWIKSVDLLYHEATFANFDSSRAAKTFHSTAEQAGIIAKNCEAKKLLIGHFSSRYNDLSINLNEALAIFQNTEIAVENETYEI